LNVFDSSAAELEKLNERVLELARHREESPEATAAWREAAQTFNADYDRLAFSGGLAREFERLRNGDLEAIELAVRYLEANPWLVDPILPRLRFEDRVAELLAYATTRCYCTTWIRGGDIARL
jgi:hypothetical protein